MGLCRSPFGSGRGVALGARADRSWQGRGGGSTTESTRIPPHSIEAEQSVLGGLLLSNLAWDRVGDLLTDGDFYRYEHKLIYAAIGALVNAAKPADVITVFEQLQGIGKAEDCGGLGYLNALAQSVPSAANMRRYAEIVRERAILRKLVAEVIVENALGTRHADRRALAEHLRELIVGRLKEGRA